MFHAFVFPTRGVVIITLDYCLSRFALVAKRGTDTVARLRLEKLAVTKTRSISKCGGAAL